MSDDNTAIYTTIICSVIDKLHCIACCDQQGSEKVGGGTERSADSHPQPQSGRALGN